MVTALHWRRVLTYLYDRFPSAMSQAGVSEEWVRGLAEKATGEAATKTAAAAAAAMASASVVADVADAASQTAVPNIAAAASSAFNATAAASGVPITSSFTEHSYGPLMFTHHTMRDSERAMHFIDLHRFPRFLDFISRISLQFVAAVA